MSISIPIVLTLAIVPMLSILVAFYLGGKMIEKKAISLVSYVVEEQKGIIKQDLETWLNSEQAQKAIYSIGAIIGSGAIAGTGLQKGTGKMKWQDLAMKIAASWIENKIPGANLLSLVNPSGQQDLKAKQRDSKVPEAK